MKLQNLLFIICLLFDCNLTLTGQQYFQSEQLVEDKEISKQLRSNPLASVMRHVWCFKIASNKAFFIAWDSTNIAGLYNLNIDKFKIAYDGGRDDTHLIWGSSYFNKEKSVFIIANRYGFPEETCGIKYFLIQNDSINYLGQIDYLIPRTENLGSGLIEKWFQAPYDSLQVSLDHNTVVIRYPSGDYVSSLNDTLKVEYKDGLEFKFLDSRFVRVK